MQTDLNTPSVRTAVQVHTNWSLIINYLTFPHLQKTFATMHCSCKCIMVSTCTFENIMEAVVVGYVPTTAN